LLPLQASTVYEFGVGVPKQFKDPQGIRRPPVILVTIEDQRGLWRNAQTTEQRLKAAFVEVVTAHGVIEVFRPVHFYRVGDVTGGIQQFHLR
jgi:hypothetical protein